MLIEIQAVAWDPDKIYGGVKPIYWITNSHLLIIGCQTAIRIYVYKQYIKRMFFCSEYLTIIIY
jgi:hypothetical protein